MVLHEYTKTAIQHIQSATGAICEMAEGGLVIGVPLQHLIIYKVHLQTRVINVPTMIMAPKIKRSIDVASPFVADAERILLLKRKCGSTAA